MNCRLHCAEWMETKSGASTLCVFASFPPGGPSRHTPPSNLSTQMSNAKRISDHIQHFPVLNFNKCDFRYSASAMAVAFVRSFLRLFGPRDDSKKPWFIRYFYIRFTFPTDKSETVQFPIPSEWSMAPTVYFFSVLNSCVNEANDWAPSSCVRRRFTFLWISRATHHWSEMELRCWPSLFDIY